MNYISPLLISVIIPTLNESDFIAKTIRNTLDRAKSPNQLELLVIDSGSADNTVEIVRSINNISIYTHPELKGKKYAILNKGVDYAKGELYLFLDADTLLPKHFDSLIVNQVINKGYIGGAFEFQLDSKGMSLRIIEFVNRIRYRIEQRYYGDQGVFCTRKAFEITGGFPEKPILESAYFCASLRRSGNLKLITQSAITSSRRFEEAPLGPLWLFAKDIQAFLLDKLGFCNENFAQKYWESNDKKY